MMKSQSILYGLRTENGDIDSSSKDSIRSFVSIDDINCRIEEIINNERTV